MDRKLLYRFFEGLTTLEEEKSIRDWMDKSNSNLRTLLFIRNEYDAQLLSVQKFVLTRKNKVQLSFPKTGIASIAAAVILILIIGGIYLFIMGNKSIQYNTVLVPAGQHINLILSDNTNLWLNANTTFRYPTKFSKESRTVYLDGEAYFEVSRNNKKPFIVKTAQGDIHVTGTIFNVEAYSKYNNFETSLFEGGVDIFKDEKKLASLKPYEKGNLEENKILITDITDTDKYLWKEGLIAFNSKKLEDILMTLEKYFDVNIQIHAKNLSQHNYTGKFRQSDGVDYALRVLQKSIHFNYKRDEDTGNIYIIKEQ